MQHTPLMGGRHTNTERPGIGAGTHQHSTPHHEAGRAPAQNQPRPGDQHNQNHNPTADHGHLDTRTMRRRRQRQTNKTSRAWRRLKHHIEHPNTTTPAARRHTRRQPRPSTTTPRTSTPANRQQESTRKQHKRNGNPTADQSHPNTPTKMRRGRRRTNKTSRAWR